MSETMTITEALAEVKVAAKKIDHLMRANQEYLYRQAGMRDPHEKDGGSAVFIQRNNQAIVDLQTRLINIRLAIADANSVSDITVGSVTMSISEWLTWRREIAPQLVTYYDQLGRLLQQARRDATKTGGQVTQADSSNAKDIVVNLNEQELLTKAMELNTTLERLDGQLSLANATIKVAI